MKIEGKEIIVDGHVPKASAEDEKTDLHAELVKRLPETEPRYVVVDWAYTTNDGRETDKVVLISWVPDSAKVKQKVCGARRCCGVAFLTLSFRRRPHRCCTRARRAPSRAH